MKRLLLAIPAVLILILAGLLIGPSFIDWSEYRVQAQDQVKKITGLDLALAGDVSLALLPSPRISAEGVSVAAPEGSAGQTLLSLKKLNIHVALMPLLSGKVAVDSVTLVEPQINIERRKDGKMNWVTPEIEALMNAKNAVQAQAPAGDARFAEAISFNKVSIDDGSFSYLDQEKNKQTTINNVDLVLRAETLQGPYKFDGSIDYALYKIAMKGGLGKYSADTKSIVPQIEAIITPGNIGVQYSGVVNLAETPEAQGETTISLENLGAFLKSQGVQVQGLDAPLTIKGLLTANAEGFAYKDLNAKLGAQEFTGTLSAKTQPKMIVEADLAAARAVNLDAFLPAQKQKNAKPFSLDFLPKTISAPAGLEAKVTLRMPSATYRGHEYGGVVIAGGKKDKAFPFLLSASEIPGKGEVEVKGDLRFASASKSEKTGGEVLADPTLGVSITGNTQNLPFTVQSLAGSASEIPYTGLWKTAAADVNLAVKPGSISAEDSSLKLDDNVFTLGGSYTEAAGGARPKANIQLMTGALNWDAIKAKLDAGKKQQTAQQKFDATALAKSLALPLDLTFDFSAASVVANGQQAGGVKAKGTILANSVTIENLSVSNFADASLSLKGKAADLKNLSGLDFSFSGDAKDVKKLANTLGVDAKSIPQQITAADAQAEFKGNLEKMAVTANVGALGGKVIAQGDLITPLTALAVNDLKLQVKHPNAAQAIRAFSPGFKAGAGFSKPLDFYTEVNRTGKVYTLNGMKGDIAGAPLTGDMRIDNSAAKPAITGNFKLGALVIDAPAKGSGGGSAGSAGSSSGQAAQGGNVRWSREAIDSSWMHKVNADIGITATSITYGAWPLQNPDIKVTLKDGTLSLSQLNAGLYGGTMALNGLMRAGADNRQPLHAEGAGTINGVQLEQFITAFAGNRIIQGKGVADIDFKVNATGISPAALVYDLAGGGKVAGSNILIEGMDLTRFARALSEESKPGDTVLGLWKGSTKGGSTAFDTLDGAFTISEGVITLNKMDLDGKQAKIVTRGTIDLPRWLLATTHEITLYERTDIPPFKMTINGPLDNPGQTFAQGVLNDYINRKVERKIQNLITDKLGLPKAEPAPAPQAQQPSATPDQVAPSGGEEAAPAPQPQAQPQQQQQITPEEAIGGLLKNLLQQ